MGVGTILRARRILLMVFGENKTAVVHKAVEGPGECRKSRVPWTSTAGAGAGAQHCAANSRSLALRWLCSNPFRVKVAASPLQRRPDSQTGLG